MILTVSRRTLEGGKEPISCYWSHSWSRVKKNGCVNGKCPIGTRQKPAAGRTQSHDSAFRIRAPCTARGHNFYNYFEVGEIRLADSAGLARLDGMDWMDWMGWSLTLALCYIYTYTHMYIYVYIYMYKPRLGEANSTSNSTPPGTPHHFFNQQKSRRFGLLSFSRAVPSKGSALPRAIALSECQVVKVA